MAELYKSMGFKDNPFSRFSAEEEQDYLPEIYVKPKYYSTIHSDTISGASRFIFGERGVGKSALVLNLMNDYSNEKIFSVLIDDYEDIPKTDNGRELLALVLSKLVTKFGLFLFKNKSCLKKCSKHDKEKLALFIDIFFETLSKKQFDDLYDKTTHIKSMNLFKRIINYFVLKPVNVILSGCTELIGSTVNKALGLPQVPNQTVYREFFPEIDETTKLNNKNADDIDYRTLKNMLQQMSTLIKTCGFNGVVIIFDKIDEYRLLETQISSIAKFVSDLLLDTALLLDSSQSLVFALWSRAKRPLSDLNVRFDKIRPIDVTWKDDEVLSIINDRLSFFSDKKVKELASIVPSQYIPSIMALSNQSPRHCITLLSKIYDEQATIDESVSVFSDDAIKNGLPNFVKSFDFGTFYAGSNPKTIRNVIREIMRVSKNEFVTKDFMDKLKISSQSANSKIRVMLEYSLIEDITSATRAKKYRIIDPRITYMIQHNLKFEA